MKNKEIEELLNELKEVTNSKKLSSTYCITNKHWQLLLSYIEQLEKENKILKDNAEHNDKVVDKVNWENQHLKKQKDDVVEYIKKDWYSKNTIDINKVVIGDWRIELLRMLGEIE